jgi:hypothetical protein
MVNKVNIQKERLKTAIESGGSSVGKLIQKPRKKPSNRESKLQQECVRWFRLEYSCYRYCLFAIPNGGKRSKITAFILKSEGALAGVADLFLAVPKVTYSESTTKHGLFIEMKIDKGVQSDSQIDFQKKVELTGYQYTICRSVDEFIKTITEYL